MPRLVDLKPRWWAEPGRHGQGIIFTSPAGRGDRLAVAFANPLDGGPPIDIGKVGALMQIVGAGEFNPDGSPAAVVPPGVLWTRIGPPGQPPGDTFETLSLSPSVDASASGNWHGSVTNGNC